MTDGVKLARRVGIADGLRHTAVITKRNTLRVVRLPSCSSSQPSSR